MLQHACLSQNDQLPCLKLVKAPEPSCKPDVLVRMVDFTVGWFLNDPVVWRRLHDLYVGTVTTTDGEVYNRQRLPIPAVPPGQGVEWKKIFECVHAKFRARMRRVSGLGDEEIRWTSYGLSYEALRRCARLGRQGQYAYVYKACVNAHCKHLQAEEDRASPALSEEVCLDPSTEIDLRIDLENVLATLNPKDETICRLRIIEGLTFKEIGEHLGCDESTVLRRFDKQLPFIRGVLREYDPANRGSA